MYEAVDDRAPRGADDLYHYLDFTESETTPWFVRHKTKKPGKSKLGFLLV